MGASEPDASKRSHTTSYLDPLVGGRPGDAADLRRLREEALEQVVYVVGCHSLTLLTDPTNVWGRSETNMMETQWCNTGNRLWPAASALSTFLAGLEMPATSTVIELGAGLGAVGIVLAMAGATRVLLTDQPQMLPLLVRNVEHQFGTVGWEHSGPPEVRALSWGMDTSFDGLPDRYDFVVASDIIYDEDTFDALRATLEQVAAPGATIIIAVHERPAAYAFFLAPSRFRWAMESCSEGPHDPVSGKTTIMIYVGRDASTSESAPTSAANGGGPATFKFGDVVEVHSLVSLAAAEALNGLKGVVVGWNSAQPQAEDRLAVRFRPPLGLKAIRTANLRHPRN